MTAMGSHCSTIRLTFLSKCDGLFKGSILPWSEDHMPALFLARDLHAMAP